MVRASVWEVNYRPLLRDGFSVAYLCFPELRFSGIHPNCNFTVPEYTCVSPRGSNFGPGLLHIEVRLPVLLCAVKTVEGDFRFCWTTTPNVGQTHKENPNLIRILYMVCTLNDIYKQYNKLHEHRYTKISSLRCVADRNPPQNASDL